MATKPPTIASLVRLSAKTEQDFNDILSRTLLEEDDTERVVEYLTRLNLPKTMALSEGATLSEEALNKVTDFDQEAVLSKGFIKFTERHIRKLKWHVSHPSLESVVPVALLFRAISTVAHLRIGRVVALLKSRDVLSAHDWGMTRELLNRAYRDFRHATGIVTGAWYEALVEAIPVEEVRTALDALPGQVYEQIRLLERLRAEIEAARLTLAVKPDGYPEVRPPRYFGGDLLEDVSWKHFWGEVANMADGLQQQVHVQEARVAASTLKVPVEGMTCGGCVRSVTRALQALPGVSEVQVSLEDKAATVTLDPAVATRAQLVGAIEDAGFDVPS